MKNEQTSSSRRDFLKNAAAGTALAAQLDWLGNVHAAGDDVLKVGVIGCGGRGSGAAENCLDAAPNVRITALADAFSDRLDSLRNRLVRERKDRVDLPPERCFVGLDAYQKVIDSGVDLVILATPPGFRPIHLEAAVQAGKHVFTEKPVAVDGPGVRKCLAAYQLALKKGLGIVAGTQRRHQTGYLETIRRLHDGAIGDVVAGRCYWNQGPIWVRKRQPGQTDLEWQMRNWYYFV
jgi:predicted dehydrogenase